MAHCGNFSYRPVQPRQTLFLRQKLLRPWQQEQECIFPHDDDPETLHAGAFAGQELIGIGTVCHEKKDGIWRIRGMAVIPALRGHSIGQKLLDYCLKHVREHKGLGVWCNARSGAVRFYKSSGFRTEGPEFVIEGIGPHYRMTLAVTQTSR